MARNNLLSRARLFEGSNGGMYGGVVSSGKGSGDERRLLRLTECRELRPGRCKLDSQKTRIIIR
jgi:hypothetical protein